MNPYVTGQTVQMLREKRGITQKQLAEQLFISDKTVSKWETGKGLPDITLLEPLAKALHVSVPELISGTAVTNRNRTANMLKTQWYVCPLCGNVISAAGEGAFHCCGIALPPLVPEEPDESHTISVECMDGEYFVRMEPHDQIPLSVVFRRCDFGTGDAGETLSRTGTGNSFAGKRTRLAVCLL